MPRFVIYWESKTDNRYHGNGTRAYQDENMVKREVAYLNKQHPDLHHYYKSVSIDIPLI